MKPEVDIITDLILIMKLVIHILSKSLGGKDL